MANALSVVNPARVEVVPHRLAPTESYKKSQVERRVSFAANPILHADIKPARLLAARAVWGVLWTYTMQKTQSQVPIEVQTSVGENANQVGYWFTYVSTETIAQKLGVPTHTVKRAFTKLREMGRLITIEKAGVREVNGHHWVGRTSDKWLITTADEQNRMSIKPQRCAKVVRPKQKQIIKIYSKFFPEVFNPRLVDTCAGLSGEDLAACVTRKNTENEASENFRAALVDDWKTNDKWRVGLTFDDCFNLSAQIDAFYKKLETFGLNHKQFFDCLILWRDHKLARPYNRFTDLLCAQGFVGARSIPAVLCARMAIKPKRYYPD